MADPARDHAPQQPSPEATATTAPPPTVPAPAGKSRRLRVLVWIGIFIALGGLELIAGAALLLGVAVIKAYGTIRSRAAVAAVRQELDAFQGALHLYRRDIGDFPSTAQGLEALRRPPTGMADASRWAGPYLAEPVPLDPWQRPYQYEYPGNDRQGRAGVWSLGPDGAGGTDDDVAGSSLAIPRKEGP